MAAQTLFIDADGGIAGLTTVDPGAESTTATGWTVAKVAPTVYSEINPGVEQASGTFAAPVLPDGTFGDLISTSSFTGVFDAGVWTATMKVIAVTSGGDQDGALMFRLGKYDATLTTFTQLTSAVVTCGTVTNLTTAAAQTSAGSTPSIGPFTLTNEFLSIAIAWKITGAGGANTRDVLMRKATGITLVTPNFTAAAAATSDAPGLINERRTPRRRSLQRM